MSVAGNIFGGLLQGVQTHIVEEGQHPVKPKEEPKFPNQDEDGGEKGMQVEIFGLTPAKFGLVVVGILGASIIAVVLYRKFSK